MLSDDKVEDDSVMAEEFLKGTGPHVRELRPSSTRFSYWLGHFEESRNELKMEWMKGIPILEDNMQQQFVKLFLRKLGNATYDIPSMLRQRYDNVYQDPREACAYGVT
ncbi:unnamed protein product [Notodromas monacha]|uniref:Uncharacterized protein n=1 Tax=Notodromas monacha TaxID=399045 RepID=A0A7R9BXC9_9CRUS|nr:unnamed protein product [Notodromas monacha]CAG0923537.1 unnamed protein product [Notodromas monacha]